MLDIGRELLEEFAKLDKVEQERRINEMPAHEIDFLEHYGYDIENNAGTLEIIRRPLDLEGFDEAQREVLTRYHVLGVNVTPAMDPVYDVRQMGEILEGVKDGLDISTFANPDIMAEDIAVERIRLIEEIREGYSR